MFGGVVNRRPQPVGGELFPVAADRLADGDGEFNSFTINKSATLLIPLQIVPYSGAVDRLMAQRNMGDQSENILFKI